MHVVQVQFADLVILTPTDTAIVRIPHGAVFVDGMVNRLHNLWTSHILPELVSRKLQMQVSLEAAGTSGVNANTVGNSSTSKVYCLQGSR